MGNSEGTVGSPRYPGPGGGLPEPPDPARGAASAAAPRLARSGDQQVPPMEEPLWEGQRAQRARATRLVARAVGKASHPRVPRSASPPRLSATRLHDAG